MDDLSKDQETGIEEAQSILQLDATIKERIERIEQLRTDIKPHKEMLVSYLENDDTYREATTLAKKASQNKSEVKKRLLSTPQGKDLNLKVEEMSEEIKEAEDSLSDLLREYQKTTGSNEFEGSDGELRQIVLQARLVRKTNLNRE